LPFVACSSREDAAATADAPALRHAAFFDVYAMFDAAALSPLFRLRFSSRRTRAVGCPLRYAVGSRQAAVVRAIADAVRRQAAPAAQAGRHKAREGGVIQEARVRAARRCGMQKAGAANQPASAARQEGRARSEHASVGAAASVARRHAAAVIAHSIDSHPSPAQRPATHISQPDPSEQTLHRRHVLQACRLRTAAPFSEPS